MTRERSTNRTVHVRAEFAGAELRRHHLERDPLRQLRTWLDDAVRAGEADPHAMTLATVTAHGDPDARIVTLKDVDEWGLVFTSSASAKTEQLRRRPIAALVFYWPLLARQVRVRGGVEALSAEEGADLYAPRSRAQRLALKTYPQGSPIPDRGALEAAFVERDRDEAEPVPKPPGWGGWRVRPTSAEFWQGRERRLHDRFRFVACDDGWVITRLSP